MVLWVGVRLLVFPTSMNNSTANSQMDQFMLYSNTNTVCKGYTLVISLSTEDSSRFTGWGVKRAS